MMDGQIVNGVQARITSEKGNFAWTGICSDIDYLRGRMGEQMKIEKDLSINF